MAWNVDQIYRFLKYQLRKNQAGGLSSTDFANAWNSEQSTYFQDLLGRFQARNNGKEGVNTGLIENETISQKLAPFTKTVTITVASGLAAKPADFAYRKAVRVNGYNAKKINQDQIDWVNHSVIDPPSATNNCYYITEYGNNFSVLPSSVTSLVLDYIANPVDIFWNYILDADERQVYTPTGSTQPQWNQSDVVEITKRTLKSFGISLKDQDFYKAGETTQATGE